MIDNIFGIDIDKELQLWDEEIIKKDGTTILNGAEYTEHVTMLQRNSDKIKLVLSSMVFKMNQFILDNMSSKEDLNNVVSSLSDYIKNEKIAGTINDTDVGKLITVSIIKLVKDELQTDYQSQINIIKDMLEVSDTSLDELREIVQYIKLNREMLNSLHITSMAGYGELDTRVKSIETSVSDNSLKIESLNSIVEIKKSLQVGVSWISTGINGGNAGLTTGVYVISCFSNNNDVDGLNWYESYSGIVSWYSNETNDGTANEIVLHSSGHAQNNKKLYLRTARTNRSNDGNLQLQIKCDVNTTGLTEYIFRFKKIM